MRVLTAITVRLIIGVEKIQAHNIYIGNEIEIYANSRP